MAIPAANATTAIRRVRLRYGMASGGRSLRRRGARARDFRAAISTSATPGDVGDEAAPHHAGHVPWQVKRPPFRAARLAATPVRRLDPVADATSWLPSAPAAAAAAARPGSGMTPPVPWPAASAASRCDLF